MSFFSDSSSLYFFSALLQANAAILSLLAIFVIFRIQALSASIDTRKFVLGSDLGVHVAASDINSFERMSLQQKKEYIERKQGKGIAILPHFEAWISYQQQIDDLKHSIITPCFALAASVLVFSVALFFASCVHALSYILELLLLVLSIALEALCLALVLRTSYSLLGIGPKLEGLSGPEKAILRILRLKK
jgi:hypothetical protein